MGRLILVVLLATLALAESSATSGDSNEGKGLLATLRALIETRNSKDISRALQKREDLGISTCGAGAGGSWWRRYKGYTSGTIQSYNYGNSADSRYWYSHNSICQWKICAPEGKRVRLTFVDGFWIEGEPGECYDKLALSDGYEKDSPTIAIVCGGPAQRPSPVTSSGNCMNVYFTTDGTIHGTGFRARFEAVQASSNANPNSVPSWPSAQINPPGCGRRQLMKRIMNGWYSQAGQWPWIVRLQLSTEPNRWMQCGGSIINNWWVLTAAHCLEYQGSQVTDPSRLTLTFGEHMVDKHETSQFQVPASKIIIHSRRDSVSSGAKDLVGPYDVALVKLQRPLTFDAYVSPVCLPTKKGMFPEDTLCYAAGWGREHVNQAVSPKLQHLDMEIKPLSTCRNFFGANTFDDLVCAKSATRSDASACRGDSGGPLACPIDGVFTLAGLTSLVIFCGTHSQTTPTEFASTEYYMDWITGTIRNN